MIFFSAARELIHWTNPPLPAMRAGAGSRMLEPPFSFSFVSFIPLPALLFQILFYIKLIEAKEGF